MTGMIHSIESFGTVDGPGIRLVVFFKGCPMRCQYCHNPDTWDMAGAEPMTEEDILNQFEASRNFYKDGGITATGGEPLLQLDFVTELFEKARKRGIHTCLDTSGITFNRQDEKLTARFDKLMASTSLVMLDIKQVDPQKHQSLTGHPNDRILDFARYVSDLAVPLWIRHVVVPGLTDQTPELYHLGRFIGSLSHVKALDVLPYHDMGKVKYQSMGMGYPLQEVPVMSKEGAMAAKKIILQGIRDQRSGNINCF